MRGRGEVDEVESLGLSSTDSFVLSPRGTQRRFVITNVKADVMDASSVLCLQ